jgi:uncharacterized protein (TIGR02757 family)
MEEYGLNLSGPLAAEAVHGCPALEFTQSSLERLYDLYNRREYIHPDPLEFVYCYESFSDREVVGLVASALAYGRVAQVLKSVALVLGAMGPLPSRFILDHSLEEVKPLFKNFKHRFTTGDHVASLLMGAARLLREFGSLRECFMAGLHRDDPTILKALTFFVQELRMGMQDPGVMLIPLPAAGSACKRMNLFLRWMVRRDDVDPGVWDGVSAARLIIPLDTHMHRIGLMLGLTNRKQADMRTALEITHAFRSLAPQDPVRYDFALTRLGMMNLLNV